MCLLFLFSFTIYIQDSSEAGNLIYIELYNLFALSQGRIHIGQFGIFSCDLHTRINMQAPSNKIFLRIDTLGYLNLLQWILLDF